RLSRQADRIQRSGRARSARASCSAERRFPFVQELDTDAVAERIASVSFVAAAPAEARRELDAAIHRAADKLGGRIPFVYVTRAYVSFAV
ncbi:MAG: hypothetical protein ACXVFE_06565, partial [Gaiellaceae bacterium]